MGFAQHHKRMVYSPLAGPLHTLKRGMGLTWRDDWQRWLVPIELAASMGFPVTAEQICILGVASVFARGNQHIPQTRSRHSVVCEIGNAMHVASVSAVLFTALWLNSWLLHTELMVKMVEYS